MQMPGGGVNLACVTKHGNHRSGADSREGSLRHRRVGSSWVMCKYCRLNLESGSKRKAAEI